MLLTPHQILNHLGFDVPAEGVEINPNDAFLATSALRLAGGTIDIGRVKSEELRELHGGLAAIVSAWCDAGEIQPIPGRPNFSDEQGSQLRITLQVLLKTLFKRAD